MTKRTRYVWLALFTAGGVLLAVGAWRQSPGEASDNQGGYLLVSLMFVVMLFMYAPVVMRSLAPRRRRGDTRDAQRPSGGR